MKRFLPDQVEGKNGAILTYAKIAAAGNVWFPDRGGPVSSLLRLDRKRSARTQYARRHCGPGRQPLGRHKWRWPDSIQESGCDNLYQGGRSSKQCRNDGIGRTADGKLWSGKIIAARLSWFDGGRFHTPDEKDGLTNSCVNALAEDSKQDLWVGTMGGGLFRFHAGHFHAFTKTDGLGGDTVNCILAARDGSLWIATSAGLTRLRDGVFRNYTPADGLSNLTIYSVLQDSSGVIWAATLSGIDRLEGERFVREFPPQDHRDMYLGGEGPLGDLYVLLNPFGMQPSERRQAHRNRTPHRK